MKTQTKKRIERDPRVKRGSVRHENGYGFDDGYWLDLKRGFCFGYQEGHSVHGETEAELLELLEDVNPCDCERCR